MISQISIHSFCTGMPRSDRGMAIVEYSCAEALRYDDL